MTFYGPDVVLALELIHLLQCSSRRTPTAFLLGLTHTHTLYHILVILPSITIYTRRAMYCIVAHREMGFLLGGFFFSFPFFRSCTFQFHFTVVARNTYMSLSCKKGRSGGSISSKGKLMSLGWFTKKRHDICLCCIALDFLFFLGRKRPDVDESVCHSDTFREYNVLLFSFWNRNWNLRLRRKRMYLDSSLKCANLQLNLNLQRTRELTCFIYVPTYLGRQPNARADMHDVCGPDYDLVMHGDNNFDLIRHIQEGI